MRRLPWCAVAGVLVTVAVLIPGRAPAQIRQPAFDHKQFNVDYDGLFTFVRIRYDERLGGQRNPGWAHDYPTAERNFIKILEEVSFIDPTRGGTNILTLDDPDLFRYPVAYLSEPGYWSMSDAEVEGLRAYLLKGGFMIVDDFRGPYELNQFQSQLWRALPGAELVVLDASHPIFDSFFHIESLDRFEDPNFDVTPQFLGVFEDNDPEKRLLLIANHNNDIGDYWEWSDAGWLPIDLSNEAYKLGVNYVVYSFLR